MKKEKILIIVLFIVMFLSLGAYAGYVTGVFYYIGYYKMIKTPDLYDASAMFNYNIDVYGYSGADNAFVVLPIPIYIKSEKQNYQSGSIKLTGFSGNNTEYLNLPEYDVFSASNIEEYTVYKRLNDEWCKYVANVCLYVDCAAETTINVTELTFNFSIKTNDGKTFTMGGDGFSIPADITIQIVDDQDNQNQNYAPYYLYQNAADTAAALNIQETFTPYEPYCLYNIGNTPLSFNGIADTEHFAFDDYGYCYSLENYQYDIGSTILNFPIPSVTAKKTVNHVSLETLPFTPDGSEETLYISYDKTLKQGFYDYMTYSDSVYAQLVDGENVTNVFCGNVFYYDDEAISDYLLNNGQ